MADAGAVTQTRTRSHGGRPSRDESARLSERILDVATALFLKDGFGATSIESVAKRAGISKRTFYHRFRSKEVLFESVVQRLLDRWLPPIDQSIPEHLDLPAALQRIAEMMLRVALTPEALALHRLVIAEAQRFPGLARIMHELGAAAGIERIAKLLEGHAGRDELSPIDRAYAAEQFIMMVLSSPRRRAMGIGTPFSPAELEAWVKRTVTLFLDGARSRR